MAGVFEIFLDAVVDLEEVCVVAVGVVGGGGGARGLEGVPGQRVHGDLGGGERAEAFEADRGGVARVGWVRGARRGPGPASVAIAVAGYARDG